jgi:hypothetical protein
MAITITASSGENGSISPTGEVTVENGANQVFTITPDEGYQILDVLVDDVSVGRTSSHTFTDVITDHTISATFLLTVIPNYASPYGTSDRRDVITITHSNGLMLHDDVLSFWVDGNFNQFVNEFKATPVNGKYIQFQFEDAIIIDHIKHYQFYGYPTQGTWQMQGSNDAIEWVNIGDTFTLGGVVGSYPDPAFKEIDFSINTTQYTYYRLLGVSGDGSNYALQLEFEFSWSGVQIWYRIYSSAGSGGEIDPSGVVRCNDGEDQTFTITPDSGYEIDVVYIDGEPIEATDTYTFEGVDSLHSISVSFKLQNVNYITDLDLNMDLQNFDNLLLY